MAIRTRLRLTAFAITGTLLVSACTSSGFQSLPNGDLRLAANGISVEQALAAGQTHCALQGDNFDGALASLRASGYTISPLKQFSSTSETRATKSANGPNFVIKRSAKGFRSCQISFRYASGLTSLPRMAVMPNGKTSWDLEPVYEKLHQDILASPLTKQTPSPRGTVMYTVYSSSGHTIQHKAISHPDRYVLAEITISPKR